MTDEQLVLNQLAQSREAVVLATVLSTRGSVPRHVGSKMIIDPASGDVVGTIGGGCGEADVIAAARDVAATGEARIIRVELLDRIDSFSPAVCGGVMEVFVERVERSATAGATPGGGAPVPAQSELETGM